MTNTAENLPERQSTNNLVSAAFSDRHIGVTAQPHIHHMLSTLGFGSLEALTTAALPKSIYSAEPLNLQAAVSEEAMLEELKALAGKNTVNKSFLGQGYYGTDTPGVIQRNVLESPAWYTAYTPYQPEISQGRLEALINFQTMIADLTGLTTANASMLDESTAVVEGMVLTRRALEVGDPPSSSSMPTRSRRPRRCWPTARMPSASNSSRSRDYRPLPKASATIFGIFVQYPGASGRVWNPADIIAASKAQGALAVVAADLLALTLITSPGELGADVAVGTSQRFGVPMGFGGPHAGYMAVRKGLERQLPGRLVGVSVDAAGHPAYRLALQTREQHIRRDKATSNICTAQVLLAVMAGMYAVYHGPEGLRAIAEGVHARRGLGRAPPRRCDVVNANFFDTVDPVTSSGPRGRRDRRGRARAGYLLRQVDADTVRLPWTRPPRRPTSSRWRRCSAPIAGIEADGRRRFPHRHRATDFLTHRSSTRTAPRPDAALPRKLSDDDSTGPRHDPAGLVHHEAQRDHRDGSRHLARVRQHPSLCSRSDTVGFVRWPRSWKLAGRDYGIRRRVTAAQCRNPGRVRRAPGHPGVPRFHGDSRARPFAWSRPRPTARTRPSAVMAGMRVVVVASDDHGHIELADLTAKIEEHRETSGCADGHLSLDARCL